MKGALLVAALAVSLTACGDHFRYPCQNPKNWNTEECKPPLCTVAQTCPEDLLKRDELKGEVR